MNQARQPLACLDRLARRRISTIRTSSWSTARVICRTPSATPRPNISPAHIPGALRFDIDAIADKSNPLPHMLPSPEHFAAQVGALGIGDGMTIVRL